MTFALGATSLSRLGGVHPKLVAVVQHAINLTIQDFTVQEGLRTLETQKEYMARGVTRTMASKHLKQADGYGHAVDLVPWVDGQPRWEWPPIYNIASAMREAALQTGVILRWGGVWDRKLNELMPGPGSLKAAVLEYQGRLAGPDFLDGPHDELGEAEEEDDGENPGGVRPRRIAGACRL